MRALILLLLLGSCVTADIGCVTVYTPWNGKMIPSCVWVNR